MKRTFFILIGVAISICTSCNQTEKKQLSDEEIWKLGWRMIASSMDENYLAADLQFDSLRSSTEHMDRSFLLQGLEVKNQLGKIDDIKTIIEAQDDKILQDICSEDFLSSFEICANFAEEKVDNKALQIELIKMYINDQAVRGNLMDNLIDKYQIDSNEITKDKGGKVVDESNRIRLNEIITSYGFPTRKLVGKDAMYGIFLMIQHSDADKEWQQSQLVNIEQAVKDGDMMGSNYAYLYDRIKVNSGQKQRYGTQFANVDPINRVVEIAETEDPENLDERRMAMGIMPIEMYKAFVLKNL